MKKYIIVIILALILFGFIVGLNNNIDLSNVYKMGFSYKYFLYMILVLFLCLSVSFIGLPSFGIYLIIDIISSGIVSGILFNNYSLSGILFSVIFIIIFKTIFWFLLLLISFYCFKFIKNNFLYLFKRFKENKRNSRLYMKKMLIISSFILIFNLLTVFLGNKVIVPISEYLLF